MSLVRSLLVLLLMSAAASPVLGEAREVCFGPGTTQMAPAAYIAVRDAAADLQSTEGGLTPLVLRAPRGSDAEARERIDQTLLELIWVGVDVGRVKVEESDALGSTGCLVLEVSKTQAPYAALWHFGGPFFDAGQSEVTPVWARRMRFIVAGYRPGVTLYRVQGHTDTQGGAAGNLMVSRQRADNVARELVRQGVRENDIVIEAHGETRLARATADDVAEPLNRRVTVDVRAHPSRAPR